MEEVLRVEKLSVRIGDVPIVAEASFEARRGEVVAIVGPNGAGKTTLLEAVVGLRPSGGHVTYGGRALDTFAERAAIFGYMPDEAALPEEASVDTILRSVKVDVATREREIRRFRLDAFLDRGGRELSRGEAKRVWLATVAMLGRSVAVLDEPFGAFDPLQLDEVLPSVRAALGEGAIALVTVHQMSIAEQISDRLVILARGRVIAHGTLEELRDRAELLGAPLEDVFRALLRSEVSDVSA